MKSKYLAARSGQVDALKKAIARYDERRKDYVAIIACLEVRENKTEVR